jgi:hypothetical protein
MLTPWNSFFQQFTQAPAQAIAVTVGASPFAYTATESGSLVITGGTISAIHLIRGSDDMNVTGSKIVPMFINDIVRVTYSVLPTLTFLPSLGPAPR